jgi:ubiquitin-activating enzyme E1
VKQPATHHFKPLAQSLAEPGEFLLASFAKMERPGVLHLAFRALHEYWARHGELPPPGDAAAAEELLTLTKALNSEPGAAGGFTVDAETLEKDAGVIRKLALGARGNLSPMAAMFGGVVGQEVLKACTGKHTPIKQWFYFDAVEALPEDPLPPEEVAPAGNRYDGQVAVLGRSLQALLANQAYFLVGAGAIGCEMLKNWAMMGVGTGAQGAIHVTDMDRIEKSNLSRQFLFRSGDIGSAKSVVAARAATSMNPALKVRPLPSDDTPLRHGIGQDPCRRGS